MKAQIEAVKSIAEAGEISWASKLAVDAAVALRERNIRGRFVNMIFAEGVNVQFRALQV